MSSKTLIEREVVLLLLCGREWKCGDRVNDATSTTANTVLMMTTRNSMHGSEILEVIIPHKVMLTTGIAVLTGIVQAKILLGLVLLLKMSLREEGGRESNVMLGYWGTKRAVVREGDLVR